MGIDLDFPTNPPEFKNQWLCDNQRLIQFIISQNQNGLCRHLVPLKLEASLYILLHYADLV